MVHVVEQRPSSIGCHYANQLRYLGFMVGKSGSSSLKAWDDVILKLKSRLSKWKVKTLSIGGRLTLLKYVLGASPIYYMSIFKVPRGVLKVMEAIRSRFFNGVDHSEKKSHFAGLEPDIPLRDKFPCLFRLWTDKKASWLLNLVSPYRNSLPVKWLGCLEQHLLADMNSMLDSVAFLNSGDRWVCDLASDGNFQVKDVRNFIDDLFLPCQAVPTRWVKYIPIKVNIFAWRARQDCLPTRVNLVRRGINIESSTCPICLTCEEDVNHIFFRCDLAQLVLRRICRWWDLDPHGWSSFQELQSWLLSIRLSSKVKSMLEGVFFVAWWFIWSFRNRSIFEDSPPRRSEIFDDIVFCAFNWCSNRCHTTYDCTGQRSISALMKSTSAVRQLAYGCVPDSLDEYLQMGATTARDSL
ncbi:RNA-directed DNA polymerase, eukaryota [Tanacetum coccineum]